MNYQPVVVLSSHTLPDFVWGQIKPFVQMETDTSRETNSIRTISSVGGLCYEAS